MNAGLLLRWYFYVILYLAYRPTYNILCSPFFQQHKTKCNRQMRCERSLLL